MPRKAPHADSIYQAAKPTVDELLANGREFNRVTADFLKVDVATALIFTEIALQTDDSIRKLRNRRSARKAYDSIVRLAEKVDLTPNDVELLSRNLERLKSELQTLGEVF